MLIWIPFYWTKRFTPVCKFVWYTHTYFLNTTHLSLWDDPPPPIYFEIFPSSIIWPANEPKCFNAHLIHFLFPLCWCCDAIVVLWTLLPNTCIGQNLVYNYNTVWQRCNDPWFWMTGVLVDLAEPCTCIANCPVIFVIIYKLHECWICLEILSINIGETLVLVPAVIR